MLRKIIFFVFAVFYLLVSVSSANAQNFSKKIYFFYGIGCPHCGEVEAFFEKEDLYNKYPVDKREIYFDRGNALLFSGLLDKLGVPVEQRGVPMVIMGERVLVGDRPIIENFVDEAERYLQEGGDLDEVVSQDGDSEPEGLDLTLAAVVAGSMVDAINPCAFAVLVILMSSLLASGKANKALSSGIAFSASIFISYFLMGLGFYKALEMGGISSLFYKIIGWMAVVLGIFNLKDFFWYGRGFLMEVPLSWRPRLKSLISSITSPGGAFTIGFLVSLFLLPCTSGPYIVILGMLAKRALDTEAIFYLLLYNFIFVSPMVLISFAIYKGFDPAKAEEIRKRRIRILHLIAGIIMTVMGIVILMGWI